ncbi:MAG: hypothetical protein JXB06_10105, partial [Spirochaetales bacterium]|nr:hypothetical protein [Spirochaetales bacterium]
MQNIHLFRYFLATFALLLIFALPTYADEAAPQPSLEILSGSYLDPVTVKNLTGRSLAVSFAEFIDGERVHEREYVFAASGERSAFHFTPAGWDDQLFMHRRRAWKIPSTDRGGIHAYKLTVKAVDRSMPEQTITRDFLVREKVLNVARVRQEGTLWCWAAGAQAILNYQGRAIYACDLVNMARRARIWPWEKDIDCCAEGPDGEGCDFGLGADSSFLNLLTGPSTYDILKQQGFSAKVLQGAMNAETVMSHLDAGKPFMIGVVPHFVVARGYRAIYGTKDGTGSYRLFLHVMDPLIYPHYLLVDQDDIAVPEGNYISLKQPWTCSITDIESGTPIVDQSGWIDLPASAMILTSFEARVQGLNNAAYAVEWYSPDNGVELVAVKEDGRVSEWMGKVPGPVSIGARIYADAKKKDSIAEKKPKLIDITPLPELHMRVRGRSNDKSLNIDFNQPQYRNPLDLYLRFRTRSGHQPVEVDVEKINLLPEWHGVGPDGRSVVVARGDDLLGPNLKRGFFIGHFGPPTSPGTYSFYATLNDVSGKELTRSDTISVTYSNPLSVKKDVVRTGESNEVGYEISPAVLDLYSSSWEMHPDLRDDSTKIGGLPQVLTSGMPGRRWARLRLNPKDATKQAALVFEVAWNVVAGDPPVDEQKKAEPTGKLLVAEPQIRDFPTESTNLTVTAPTIWPGVVDRYGLNLKRQQAKGGATAELCPHQAVVFGEVSGKVNPSFAPRSVEEIRQKFEKDKISHERDGRTVEVRSFSIGDYKGFILESTMRYLRGGWSGDGYRDSRVEAIGHALVTRDGRTFEITYGIGSIGCWNNSQRGFQESQSAAARAEAQSILAGIRLSEKPALVQVPYTGAKLDGSDLPVVRLRPEKIPVLKVGEMFTIEAVVENAKPENAPTTFEWTGTHGNAENLRSAAATIMPTAPGKFSVAVSVGGQQHHIGSASLEYTVADYKVHVERVPGNAGPVPLGARAGFRALLTVNGKPAQGAFIYRWQPHPEAGFDKLDAAEPDVQAVFSEPGRIKVWVQVLEKREGREITVAESEQLDIDVVAPKLSLNFEPAEPMVGQNLKARLKVEPEIKEIDLRWMPLPSNAQQGAQSADGRELALYMKDDKPVPITVMARVPGSGEILGTVQGSITARKYAVTVAGPHAIGPKPRIWKEGVGLVEVEGAFAVDQIVEFTADTQPAALTGPLKYSWNVASGPCRVGNPASREARATASENGTCELSVSVRDRNDVELGVGQGSFSATVTRAAVQQGQQRAGSSTPVEALKVAPALAGAWTVSFNGYPG